MALRTKPKTQTDEFPLIPQEIRDRVLSIKQDAQLLEYSARLAELEGGKAAAEAKLKDHQWRPDQDDGEWGRRVAHASTIDAAAVKLLDTGELDKFSTGIDARREELRNEALVWTRAIEKYKERHSQIWLAAVRENQDAVLPLVEDARDDVLEAAKGFLTALHRQQQLRVLLKRKGFRREYFSAVASDTFEDGLLGYGEPLRNYVDRRSQFKLG